MKVSGMYKTSALRSSGLIRNFYSISVPIASRLTRVAPNRDLTYKGYVIPAGVSLIQLDGTVSSH